MVPADCPADEQDTAIWAKLNDFSFEKRLTEIQLWNEYFYIR